MGKILDLLLRRLRQRHLVEQLLGFLPALVSHDYAIFSAVATTFAALSSSTSCFAIGYFSASFPNTGPVRMSVRLIGSIPSATSTPPPAFLPKFSVTH